MKHYLPPLYALRAFSVAANSGSFSQAAKELNITASAISRHIKTLEEYFEFLLFTRNGPKIALTYNGQILAGQLTDGFEKIKNACFSIQKNKNLLRIKTPSSLTMLWLLDLLPIFNQQHKTIETQLASVWMDIDVVDFNAEPYDCAILLGNGEFGKELTSKLLFKEWLIPICSKVLLPVARENLARCELIHSSSDRRDWLRWHSKAKRFSLDDLSKGKLFDTLVQANLAAIGGHGIAITDLLLTAKSICENQLSIPTLDAVATGDSYYLVYPKNSPIEENINIFFTFLLQHLPVLPCLDFDFIE